MSHILEILVGKLVTGVTKSEDGYFLSFQTDQGDFDFYAYGDCCSSSWFEHINGLSVLLGQTINRVVQREMPESVLDPEHDCLSFYGWTLETALGRFDLEMRNASNGYYGGEICYIDPTKGYRHWSGEYYKDKLLPLTEDF